MPATQTTTIDSDEAQDIHAAIDNLLDRLGIAGRLQFDTDAEYAGFVNQLTGTVIRAVESADPDDYGRDVYARMDAARRHPDYVLGVMFTADDLAERGPKDDSYPLSYSSIEDRMSERGNEMLDDLHGAREEE